MIIVCHDREVLAINEWYYNINKCYNFKLTQFYVNYTSVKLKKKRQKSDTLFCFSKPSTPCFTPAHPPSPTAIRTRQIFLLLCAAIVLLLQLLVFVSDHHEIARSQSKKNTFLSTTSISNSTCHIADPEWFPWNRQPSN